MASSPRHGVLGDETAARPGLRARLRRILFGKPRDLADQSLFHRLSLIPLLAWIGLGSDGLSSSAYGPQEALRTLGEHRYLAIPLALMIAATVCLISAVYSRIIEEFPRGGGGVFQDRVSPGFETRHRFLWGRRSLPRIGRDTRPPPPRRLMGAGRLRRLFRAPRAVKV